MSLPLERLQAMFAAALTDGGDATRTLADFVVPAPCLLDRLALYRGNVRAAWAKALANAYPVVRTLVGEEFFSALAHSYGREHPSISGDLNRFGAQFGVFVRDFPQTQALPYLRDVAELEWCVHRAHYAVDGAGIRHERITSMAPGELLASHVALHPACAWTASAFPIVSLWLAHQPDSSEPMPAKLDRREFALVVRPRWRVEVLVSSAGEIAALAQLQAGSDMECAIGAALGVEPRFDFPRALVRWLDHAILTDIRSGLPGAVCGSG
ncbi:MAG TPA: DNA-binding domain-containing protein [Rudaea sp.]|jgi:hypothetical protein